MTGSPSGDWRKKISPSKSPSSAAWKARKPTSLSSSQNRTRLKLASLATVTVMLIVILVPAIWQRANSVPLLAICVTNYRSPIPPNSFADEDLQRIHDTLDEYDNVNVVCESNPPDAKKDFLDLVRTRLRDIRLGGPGGNTAIIYVSAHGVVDENGHPCLLLGSSDPLNSATWLSVQELISAIQQVENVSTAHKLVVLDANRVGANWTLGQLYNGFADALPGAIDVAGAENLAVINSASPGQTSSVSLSLGGSLFGFSFADAMRGAAELRAGQFDVKQLHDFLRKSVSRHSNSVGLEPQLPQLVTPETNFPVAFAAGYQQPTTEATDVSNSLLLVDELWEQHRELKRSSQIQSYLNYPLKWANLEQGLLRLEELSLAGAAYKDEFDSARIEAESIIRALRDADIASPFPGSSLAVANLLNPISTDDDDAVKARWELWIQSKKAAPSATTPPPSGSDSTEASPDADASEKKAQAPLDYHAAADFVWRQLASQTELGPNESSSKNTIDTAISFLDENCIQPTIDYSEIQLLRIAQSWSEPNAYYAIRPFLSSLQFIETLCAPEDIRSHYWLEVSSRNVQNNIRWSFDDLLVGSPTSLARANNALENEAVDEDGRSLSTLAADSKLISDAYQLRDRIFSALPYYAQWSLSMDGFRESNGLFRSVQSLAVETTELAATLDQLSDPINIDGVKRLQTQFESTEKNLRELESVIGGRIIELETSGNDRKARVGLSDALRLPDLSKRKLLRNMQVKKLSGQVGIREVEFTAPDNDDEYVAWLANASSAALTVLTGIAEQEDSADSSRSENVNRLAKIGGQIRSHLAANKAVETLIRQSREALSGADAPIRSSRAGLSAADQACRRIVSFSMAHPWAGRSSCPSSELRAVDHQAWLLWQGRRRLIDFYGSYDGQNSGGLFVFDATREHVRAASMFGEETAAHQRQLIDKLDQTKAALNDWKPIKTVDAVRLPDERRVRHEIDFLPYGKLPRGRVSVYVASQNQTIDLGDTTSNRVIRRRAADMRSGQLLKHALIEPDTYSDFDAVALFRGHLVSVPFLGKENNGQVVRVAHRQIPQASIRVRGRDAGVTQIVFVFDCSGSMNDPLPSRRKRMTVAQSVLAEIVRTLPINEAKFQVTLLAYGRNSHWSYNEPADTFEIKPSRHFQLAFPDRQPPHPGDDVDIAFEHDGLLNEQLSSELQKTVFRLSPFGETPLYYAVQKALGEVKTVPGKKYVIVITDGDSKVTTESYSGLTSPRQNKLLDPASFERNVLSQLDPDVKLNFVFFDFGGGALETLLTRYPQVGIYKSKTRDNLQEAIDSSLNIAKFYVRPTRHQEDLRKQLNSQWTETVNGIDAERRIILDGYPNVPPARVELFGGEELDLLFNDQKSRLEHRRFDVGIRERATRLPYPDHADRGEKFFVASHLTRTNPATGAIEFHVSVQNDIATEFSKRPKHIWAEIRPVFVEGETPSEHAYFAYDVQLVENRPVPVLQFEVRNWPVDARFAEIRLWFTTYDDVEFPKAVISLDRPTILTGSQLRSETCSLKCSPEYGADGAVRLAIEESHQADGDYPLWISITPKPTEVIHEFLQTTGEVQNRRARHIYRFSRKALQGRRSVELRAGPKRRIITDWVDVKDNEGRSLRVKLSRY